jgi:flagellar basal-body rod protein FlgF
MENAAYIGLSQQLALRRRLDVTANNLANMNTTAFKAENVMFSEYLMKEDARSKLSFVQDHAVYWDLKEGKLVSTGNSFDVAISGEGYFTVETENGPRYTRNGHFRLDGAGQLITDTGNPVLDDQGAPILINTADGAVTIAEDGTISNDFGPVARLQAVTFEDARYLKKIGDGLYEAGDQVPEPNLDATLLQGMTETSNVEPIVEMTRMIEIMRSYQSAQKMLEAENDMQRKAIDRLPKVS